MRFEIVGGPCGLQVGEPTQRGRELSYFIPDTYEWTQLNYGQGEGQALIGGAEWGFYVAGPGVVSVKLHVGKIAVSDAIQFVGAVNEKIFSGRAELRLVGEDEAI